MAANWDRMKGENTMWFARFEVYRLLGPERKLQVAFRHYQVEKGRKQIRNVPSSWRNAFDKYDWKQRAEAWDLNEQKKIRKENEKLRQRARDERKKLILEGIAKLREGLQCCDPESAKFGEIMTGIKTLSNQARLEFGDNVLSTPVSHDIFEALLAGEITVREAALRYNKEGLPLPKAVEIMLAKEPPEEPGEDDSKGAISEIELDRLYEERLVASKCQEKEFVPERKEAVEKLKKELADQDSFKDTSFEVI